MTRKPVWVWLPGQHEPVRCGEFSLDQGVGRFNDDPTYRARPDAVGALAVCDDIASKLAFAAPSSGLLLDTLAALPPEWPSSQAARTVKDLAGTSLGGERPKLTVLHRGQLWIATLQDRGDPPHAPLREYVSMRLAQRCGIRTAEVEFRQVGGRELVLVRAVHGRRRRDAARAVAAHGVQCHLRQG